MTICAIVTGKGHVRRVALAALAALCRPVVAGGDDDVPRELAGLPVDVIDDNSVSGALRVVLGSTPNLDAVLVLRADQRSLRASDLSRLFARFRASRALIVASAYERTVGLPAVFGRAVFGELLELAPEADVKNVIAVHSPDVVTVPMPRAGSQIESAEEYAMLRSSEAG